MDPRVEMHVKQVGRRKPLKTLANDSLHGFERKSHETHEARATGFDSRLNNIQVSCSYRGIIAPS